MQLLKFILAANLLKVIAENDCSHFLKHYLHSILQSLSSYDGSFVAAAAYTFAHYLNRKKLLISKTPTFPANRRSTIHTECPAEYRRLIFPTGCDFIKPSLLRL